MNSGCKSSISCVEALEPVRANYVNLYKWPESDAEFVKSLAGRAKSDHAGSNRWTSVPVVDSYSCRQMYLRSYTFSKKKESLPEKTKRCLGKVKQTAAVFPFLNQIRSADSSCAVSFRSNASNDRSNADVSGDTNCRKRKKSKKNCGTAGKPREFSCSALVRSIFRRLLSCTASVDVVVQDRQHKCY